MTVIDGVIAVIHTHPFTYLSRRGRTHGNIYRDDDESCSCVGEIERVKILYEWPILSKRAEKGKLLY
jgi:hypothetical protein